MSTYEDMAELIRLGAYRRGSDSKVDEAIAIYREVVANAPDYPQGHYRLAELLLNHGDLKGASAAIDDILKHDATDRQAMILRARIEMQTGDTIRSNGRRDGATFRIIGTRGQMEFWGWERDYHLINAQHPEGKLITPEELSISLHQRHLENLLPMREHKISEPIG